MFYLDKNSDIFNYFSGIAYGGGNVVLSLKGLEEYSSNEHKLRDLSGGRYSLVFRDMISELIVVQNDPTGQDAIFLYEKKGFWAISNSLYKLVEELKKRGEKLSIYYPALNSYKISHSLGNQPITNNTIVENIKIIPRGHRIEIKSGNVNIKKIQFCNIVVNDIEDYIKYLDYTLQDLSMVLKAIRKTLPKGNLRCDLTGGLDSRSVFGIAYNSGVIEDLQIVSNKKFEDDYVIADVISKYYGGQLSNNSMPEGESIPSDFLVYELYKYGNAGIYTKLYKPRYLVAPNALHLHGAGGESLRGQYSGTPRQVISRLKKYFPNDIKSYELVKKEFLNYFESNNLDIDDTKSMLHHSRNFRARFHFGRNWFRSLSTVIFSPLCDARLERLSDFIIDKYPSNPRMIFYHMFFLLDKTLAFFPFDDTDKNMNIQQLKLCLDLFNKRKESLSNFNLEYRVYGTLEENSKRLDLKIGGKESFNELIASEKAQFLKKAPIELQWVANNISIMPILNIIY
ncbi:hypothetical protein DC083_03425 [Ignatzschineria ureiclastica]|uniref:Asparagine synthetase domain-containing protein n=1 Tax=Ignatzschineria ureiclastica TaxID=472582 RepID=A0A2U2AFS5_9GAMM|nr:hypothetical protein [Ignatzschineria ureiclastica]PWD81511.1 hypothetical protein DC083_03425 [Ignatzschineria ureiclastica]GHA01202.1 hypothetical protein GCM10007162_16910 [Ignatzschineria ureiclastica]